MTKERLGAFMDAVIAIIMTILVLELEKPDTLTWHGLWDLRASFFAYALSFFWLGAMWVNLHHAYHEVETVSQHSVWSAVVMLFFGSLFPYTTKLIAGAFNNSMVQSLYGMLVLCITATVMWHYRTLVVANPDTFKRYNLTQRNWIKMDVGIKIVGLLLSMTIFPPAMSIAVLVTLCVFVIPNQFKTTTTTS